MFVSSIPENLEGKANFISSDYRNAARIITRKVLAAGHRKMVFLDGQSAGFVRKEIKRGMEDAFDEFDSLRGISFPAGGNLSRGISPFRSFGSTWLPQSVPASSSL